MGFCIYNDVVFNFDPSEYRPRMNQFISACEVAAGEKLKAEVETHFRDEYSTFSWIMEGMLTRAGFKWRRRPHHKAEWS